MFENCCHYLEVQDGCYPQTILLGDKNFNRLDVLTSDRDIQQNRRQWQPFLNLDLILFIDTAQDYEIKYNKMVCMYLVHISKG